MIYIIISIGWHQILKLFHVLSPWLACKLFPDSGCILISASALQIIVKQMPDH